MVKLAISEGRDSKVFWEGHLDLKKKKERERRRLYNENCAKSLSSF